MGPKKLITPAIEEDIVNQLALDPTLYLDKIAAYVREQHAVDISLSTISCCLKARSVSKKVSVIKSFETIRWAVSRSEQLAKYFFLMSLPLMSVRSSAERAGLLEVLLLTKHSRLNGLSTGASCYAMAFKGLSAMTSYMAVLRWPHITPSSWSRFCHDAIYSSAQTVSSAWITLESIAQTYVFFIYYRQLLTFSLGTMNNM
ncbi:MAG: hypothetical protein M1840_002974 [Geoglossum simile]|nr:MAG: hypothetical protein M1840_002974 [Geoglossum simile]